MKRNYYFFRKNPKHEQNHFAFPLFPVFIELHTKHYTQIKRQSSVKQKKKKMLIYKLHKLNLTSFQFNPLLLLFFHFKTFKL